MFNYNYFSKYSKEQLDELLSELMEFQSWQALGLFLTRVSWLTILIGNLWNANMTNVNKFVFGILFTEYPFAVYLFRELGFNIGLTYTSLLIGVSIFVFIMTGIYNLVDVMVSDIADAIEEKDNHKEENEDE